MKLEIYVINEWISEWMSGLEQSSQILDYIRITKRLPLKTQVAKLSILEFFDSVDQKWDVGQ